MSGWNITANDIKNWTATNKRLAEEMLPLLIKKLILASVTPEEIDFPSGDSIAVGGWDGVLNVKEGTKFVPEGKSGWEFGTNNSVKNKADKDYKKRSDKPEPFSPEETSFVFVTSRLWTTRDKWVSEKKSDQIWKDVKGINASTLAEWLEYCPAVHRWFAQILGKREPTVKDIDQAWEEYSNITEKPLTTSFFKHNRENEISELSNFLTKGSGVFRILSTSKAEAYGFVLAVIQTNEIFGSRALFIKSQESWDFMLENDQPLILVPYGFQPTNIGAATAKNHLVIIIDDQYAKSPSLTLERQPRLVREEAIKTLGFNDSEANTLYQDTKGYLEPILRHDWLKPRDVIYPVWLDKYDPEVLFTVLFSSEWIESNENDKQILEKLSDLPYEQLQKQLTALSKEPDPPVRYIRDVWQVISKLDLWFLIFPRLSKTYLDRLKDVIPLIFTDFDPAYDLSPDERFFANIHGTVPKYSGALKSGIADTLALLANFGDDYSNHLGGISVQSNISYWLRTLYEENNHVRFWFSLDSCTLSFAEAAPKEFLDAIDASSQGSASPMLKIFEAEGEDTFSGVCYHSNILWGLESISWNKLYLTQTCSCLARLSEIDPGGRWGKRPFSSLVDVFLGWINNVSATHDERLKILQHVLIPNFPDIAWKLMLKLINTFPGMTSGVHKPKYRDWALSVDSTTTNVAYMNYTKAIVDLLLNEVDNDLENRIIDLIKSFDSYTEKQIEAILAKFLSLDDSHLNDDQRIKILDSLRNTISHHREFPDTDWSWEEALLKRLEDIYNKFNFPDAMKSNSFLFRDYHPNLIEPLNKKEFDHYQREELLSKKRIDVVEQITKEHGSDGIIHFIENVSYPDIIGNTAYFSPISNSLESLAFNWINESGKKKAFSKGFLTPLAHNEFDRAKQLLVENKDWATQTKAEFLLSFPINEKTLTVVDAQPTETQKYFWMSLDRYFSADSIITRLRIVEKFFKYDRPFAAIDVMAAALYKKEHLTQINPSLVADILKKAISNPADMEQVGLQRIHYDILKCIEFLQHSGEIPDETMVQIEWNFLKLFEYQEQLPKTLIKAVADDPSFFAQLISWMYKRKDGKEDSPETLTTEQMQIRAENAWNLLNMITTLPGQSGEDIDQNILNTWVTSAREQLEQIGRKDIGDSQIGEYLSHCPKGKDGFWPHEAVRSVLEKCKSKKIEDGLVNGKHNLRGITSRHPYAGGDQERILANQYTEAANVMSLTFPRTALVLRELSEDYKYHAKRHDQDVELHD
ncbi:hypothetical protein [Hydrogenovibrio sp. JE_KL2]|uniref:hypothetical protein n=1 Tax=Hydrogenovibrio sp. JE_KL2 TaxID=2651188 RepID=UPI00128BF814|nr:hypothetical protein [Hydrogenovibrio sp. JE_KL2]MPQ76334.1 hypothetical protein [Hydrogenovibrio sp. JE_KL2]